MQCALFAGVFKAVWRLLFYIPNASFSTDLTKKRAGPAGNSYPPGKVHALM